MSLIPFKRFSAAAARLARYKFKRIATSVGPMTALEASEINRCAAIPYACVKLAKRLWARGHMILDEETREVARSPTKEC